MEVILINWNPEALHCITEEFIMSRSKGEDLAPRVGGAVLSMVR